MKPENVCFFIVSPLATVFSQLKMYPVELSTTSSAIEQCLSVWAPVLFLLVYAKEDARAQVKVVVMCQKED